MFRYECKKLFGSRVLLLVIALLVANLIVCFVQIEERDDPLQDVRNREIVCAAYQLYRTSPKSFSEETFSDDLFLDKEIRTQVMNDAENCMTYRADLKNSLDSISETLKNYDIRGVKHSEFIYQYTRYVYDKSKAFYDKNISLGFEYIRGWNVYFEYTALHLFNFLATLLIAGTLKTSDRICGFYPILFATKHGRIKTAASKLAAIAIISTITALAFSLSSFVLIVIKCGLSSPGNVLQALETFRHSPYALCIIDNFFISLFVRIAITAVLSVFCSALFSLIRNSYVAYVAGAAAIVLELWLYTSSNISSGSFFKINNLFYLSDAEGLVRRVRAFPFFAGYIDEHILCVLLAVITIAFCIPAAILINHYRRTRRTLVLKKVAVFIPKVGFLKKASTHIFPTYNLLFVEIQKIITPLAFLLTALLLCGSFYLSYSRLKSANDYSSAVYNSYMDILSGTFDTEGMDYVNGEYERLRDVVYGYNNVVVQYGKGLITEEEYYQKYKEYIDARGRLEVFERIVDKANSFADYEKETGKTLWFVHDIGWNRYFEQPNYVLFILLVLLLFSRTFSMEYKNKDGGSFSKILLATSKGRNTVFFLKLASALLICTVIYVIMTGGDLLMLERLYGLPEIEAPLASLDIFRGYTGNMSIGGYLVFSLLISYLSGLGFSALAIGFSAICKKALPATVVVSTLTILPHFAVLLGVNVLSYIDFWSLATTHSFTVLSVQLYNTAILNVVFIVAIWMMIFIVLIIANTCYTRRRLFWNTVFRQKLMNIIRMKV